MFFELDGWDTLLNLEDIIHISIFPGTHKFNEYKEYSLFKSKTRYQSILNTPSLRVWYRNSEKPFTFSRKEEKYEIYRTEISPVYNQEKIEELLNEDYDELNILYNKIKKALNVYQDTEEDKTENSKAEN